MAKRRANGDGLMRKRSDGRWEGRIVVGHKDQIRLRQNAERTAAETGTAPARLRRSGSHRGMPHAPRRMAGTVAPRTRPAPPPSHRGWVSVLHPADQSASRCRTARSTQKAGRAKDVQRAPRFRSVIQHGAIGSHDAARGDGCGCEKESDRPQSDDQSDASQERIRACPGAEQRTARAVPQ